MDSEDNMTIRRGKSGFNYSFDSLNHLNLSQHSTPSDYLAKSLPDLSVVSYSRIEELKNEIKILKSELESSNLEIEKLLLENSQLKIK